MSIRVQRRMNQPPDTRAAVYFTVTPAPSARVRAAFCDYGERLSATSLWERELLQPRIQEWVLAADNSLRNYRFDTLKSQAGREIDLKEYEYHERLYHLIQRVSRMIINGETYDIRDFHVVVGLNRRPSEGTIVELLPLW